jgi:hypothetical protein
MKKYASAQGRFGYPVLPENPNLCILNIFSARKHPWPVPPSGGRRTRGASQNDMTDFRSK